MILSSVFSVLLSFLFLELCWKQLNASGQETLTSSPDEDTQKGSAGSSQKRGPNGSIIVPGRKGMYNYVVIL